MRSIKSLFILLFIFFAISCSVVKTAYNNAPALTQWWLDDYFDLTAAQKTKLKPALQELHEWHRKNELPSYVVLLKNIQTDLSHDSLDSTKTCERVDAIKSSANTLQVKSIPIIVEIGATLSDKQLNHFEQKLDKRTEKWKSEWWQETKQEQLDARLEKSKDFAEKVYGDLSDAQIDILKQGLAQANIDPAITYNEILRRDEDALSILKSLKNPAISKEEKTKLVNAGLNRMQKSPNDAYELYADKITQHTCETIARLHASTSNKQKLHAKSWLNDYIAQLTNLQTK